MDLSKIKAVDTFNVTFDHPALEGVEVLLAGPAHAATKKAERARAMEASEVGLKRGSGRLTVYVLPEGGVEAAEPELWKFSLGLHCPESTLTYQEPIPSLFSFNSAVGACDACRGFGRVIGVDWGLVIPNEKLTLRTGVIKPSLLG